ncbi:TetR/AcrR family transcriptional regulator [Ktedonospora formicarum]|uniref:TetR/AcrR family transcriptional regulator n=1 Tax=Ktedonospora formicarum TaxID=2778364 RepID=UPI001F389EEC|nr:TetR/AcrR family transcriptional regulator [Ktedonospora formicarum]
MIEERGFEALTIGEITQRAMVSRAAFYRNYQDKYDLVERIFEEEMSNLLKAAGDMGPERPPQAWVKFFEHIAEYERFYGALLGRRGSPWFVLKMRASLADMVKEHGREPSLMGVTCMHFPTSLCQIWYPLCLLKPLPGGLSREDLIHPERSPHVAHC